MHLLVISLDADLARDDARQRANNVLERHLRYAAALERLSIVVKTLGNHTPSVLQPAGNCRIYPTRSRSRWHFLRDAYRQASALCRAQRIDAISCQDPFAAGLVGVWLKRRFGIPLNVHVMADMIDNAHFQRERWLHRGLQMVARRVVWHADTVRVSTQAERDMLRPRLAHDASIWAIPLPVEPMPHEAADGAAVRARYLTPPFRLLWVAVARLTPQKDVEMLLRAMRLVIRYRSDLKLLIIGDGPERARLERCSQAWELAPHVEFVGAVPAHETPAYVAATDGFVLTSRYEGMPRVLVEAALWRRPIVATRTVGAAELLEDGVSGYLVEVGDATACAQRMLNLLDHPELRRQMGEQAAQRARMLHNHERILAQYAVMWQATAARTHR